MTSLVSSISIFRRLPLHSSLCLLAALFTSMVFSGCMMSDHGDNQACDTAVRWADAYFNSDYREALSLSTPESEPYIRFVASNTTESDLELLRYHAAEVDGESSRVVWQQGDTLCEVSLCVSHYILPTLLCAGSRQSTTSDEFRLKLVRREGRWLVRMGGPLRSERQNRD